MLALHLALPDTKEFAIYLKALVSLPACLSAPGTVLAWLVPLRGTPLEVLAQEVRNFPRSNPAHYNNS